MASWCDDQDEPLVDRQVEKLEELRALYGVESVETDWNFEPEGEVA